MTDSFWLQHRGTLGNEEYVRKRIGIVGISHCIAFIIIRIAAIDVAPWIFLGTLGLLLIVWVILTVLVAKSGNDFYFITTEMTMLSILALIGLHIFYLIALPCVFLL